MLTRALKLAALAASASAVCVAGADATRTVRIASHISIKSRGLTFSGRVTSSNAACKGGRTVVLHRTNGNILGSQTTPASGKWKITASGSAGITLGHFYATVKRRAEGTAGTIYVCKSARSKTIPYHA
jgi:hypothetical protein